MVDDEGGLIPYVIESTDVFSDVSEDETITVQNAKIENRDGGDIKDVNGKVA